MSELKATPGPWRLSENDEGHVIEMGTYLQPGRKFSAHRITYDHGTFFDDDYASAQDEYAEAEANACLIAAAPELLEALERLDSAIAIERSGNIELEGWMDAVDELDAAREQARAALAKARGEQ